jgi:hypothetical protein
VSFPPTRQDSYLALTSWRCGKLTDLDVCDFVAWFRWTRIGLRNPLAWMPDREPGRYTSIRGSWDPIRARDPSCQSTTRWRKRVGIEGTEGRHARTVKRPGAVFAATSRHEASPVRP